MGWKHPASLDTALHRARHQGGTFPLPDLDGRWSRAEVEAWRDARSNRGVGLTGEQLDQVRRLRRAGRSAPAIAAIVGCTPASVYRILRREAATK